MTRKKPNTYLPLQISELTIIYPRAPLIDISTLELKLLNKKEKVIKEKNYKMKRYIMWRPFIIDIKDTRLPFNEPRSFAFKFKQNSENRATVLDITVRYHLLDEKQRKKTGYENKAPRAYPIYNKRIIL